MVIYLMELLKEYIREIIVCTRELLNEVVEKGMLEEKGVTKGKR